MDLSKAPVWVTLFVGCMIAIIFVGGGMILVSGRPNGTPPEHIILAGGAYLLFCTIIIASEQRRLGGDKIVDPNQLRWFTALTVYPVAIAGLIILGTLIRLRDLIRR